MEDNTVSNFHTLLILLSVGTEQIDADTRLITIIEGLNQKFDITLESIALCAKLKLDETEIEEFLKSPGSLSYEKRYILAVTSLFLHFFL